jgi:hypothetical protein
MGGMGVFPFTSCSFVLLASTVVVDDLNVLGAANGPAKANSVLVIYADRMLTGTVAGKGFKAVTWRRPQVVMGGCRVEHQEFPLNRAPDIVEPP